MKEIVNKIQQFKAAWLTADNNENAKETDRREFTLLLSGISACRMMPGVPVHMGYEELYHCEDNESISAGREHMERLFDVKDKASLIESCYKTYSGSEEYELFMTFWKGAPSIDTAKFNPRALQAFNHCNELAKNFYPLLREKGFYAWDINERIGLCRNAVACGIISEEEFWNITDVWVRQAQVFYHSYKEYALSCVCGAMYQMGRYDEDVTGFLDINLNLLENLLGEGGAWQRNKWYVPKEREWVQLIENREHCLITKKALETGRIGYMYREKPQNGASDSGWCFFVGDETDEYVNNPDNISVCMLNTICNICPEVMAYLHAEYGRRFGCLGGVWREE